LDHGTQRSDRWQAGPPQKRDSVSKCTQQSTFEISDQSSPRWCGNPEDQLPRLSGYFDRSVPARQTNKPRSARQMASPFPPRLRSAHAAIPRFHMTRRNRLMRALEDWRLLIRRVNHGRADQNRAHFVRDIRDRSRRLSRSSRASTTSGVCGKLGVCNSG
jgi:hypothetical protein